MQHWFTRLAESDYTAIVDKVDRRILFRDNRNRRVYKLGLDAHNRLVQQVGTNPTQQRLIQAAINAALIPHPYDEYQ